VLVLAHAETGRHDGGSRDEQVGVHDQQAGSVGDVGVAVGERRLHVNHVPLTHQAVQPGNNHGERQWESW